MTFPMRHSTAALTTVRQNFAQLGRETMRLLMGMMRERAPAADVVLPVELIVRASTARPRG